MVLGMKPGSRDITVDVIAKPVAPWPSGPDLTALCVIYQWWHVLHLF